LSPVSLINEIFDILELVITMQQQAYSSQANYIYIMVKIPDIIFHKRQKSTATRIAGGLNMFHRGVLQGQR
jgi:hypothetical protein